MKYQVITKDGRAKRAQMETVHGTIQTPVFMNVGTVGAIKGAVSTDDLRQIGTQVELSNTYHLHVRTGDSIRDALKWLPLDHFQDNIKNGDLDYDWTDDNNLGDWNTYYNV